MNRKYKKLLEVIMRIEPTAPLPKTIPCQQHKSESYREYHHAYGTKPYSYWCSVCAQKGDYLKRYAQTVGIAEFYFPMRAVHLFETMEVKTMADLIRYSGPDFLKWRGFGWVTLFEVKLELARWGVQLSDR